MLEIRKNPDESLDELVAEQCELHIEQMADAHWWIGITCGDKVVHINLTSECAIDADVLIDGKTEGCKPKEPK